MAESGKVKIKGPDDAPLAERTGSRHRAGCPCTLCKRKRGPVAQAVAGMSGVLSDMPVGRKR